MNFPFLIFSAMLLSLGSAVLETVFLRHRYRENHWKSFFCKGLSALSFCGVGLLFALHAPCSRSFLILSGLFMGFLGDELLALRKLYPRHHDFSFFAGALAFSAGHFFYFSALQKITPLPFGPFLLLFLILITCSEAFLRLCKCQDHRMHLPGLIYIGIEAIMCAGALYCACRRTGPGTLLFAIGGLSFLISDNLLCVFTFGNLRKPGIDQALHITYLSAQLLIAWSILLL